MIRLKQTTSFTIALWIALSGSIQAQSVPQAPTHGNDSSIFNAPPPPSTGRPGRRSDAGSRGCAGDEASTSEPTLLALVPTQEAAGSTVVFGKTAAERPTFWFYVPQRSSSTATFVLQDQEGNPVHESDVALPETAGILSVSLPATVAPLEPGKLYHWFFKLYCRSISPPDSFVDGWIQRESPTADLSRQLAAATGQQQVRLYAANGFWFDALTAAAGLQRTTSGDPVWAELLGSVGLEDVASKAIVTP